MKSTFTFFLLSLCFIGLSQSSKDDWNYTIDWGLSPSSIDTVASLQIEVRSAWAPDSVEALWIQVENSSAQPVYEATLPISVNCLAPANLPCTFPIPQVKTGFYKYHIRLVYKDQSTTTIQTLDQTSQL